LPFDLPVGQPRWVGEERRWDIHMATGKVKWFNDQKGYGFIERDGGGEDVFVHYSGITGDGYRSLEEGAVVEFEVVQDPKGPRADNVKLISGAAA
jgi:cold shock protein